MIKLTQFSSYQFSINKIKRSQLKFAVYLLYIMITLINELDCNFCVVIDCSVIIINY